MKNDEAKFDNPYSSHGWGQHYSFSALWSPADVLTMARVKNNVLLLTRVVLEWKAGTFYIITLKCHLIF